MSSMVAKFDSELEMISAVTDDRERIAAFERDQRQRQEEQAILTAQKESSFGLLNPMNGTAHIPKSVETRMAALPPGYYAGSGGAPMADPSILTPHHSSSTNVNTMLDAPLRSNGASGSEASRASEYGTSLSANMPTQPAPGGSSSLASVSVNSNLRASPLMGKRDAASVTVSLNRSIHGQQMSGKSSTFSGSIRDRPAPGGTSGIARVNVDSRMAAVPCSGGTSVPTAVSMNADMARRPAHGKSLVINSFMSTQPASGGQHSVAKVHVDSGMSAVPAQGGSSSASKISLYSSMSSKPKSGKSKVSVAATNMSSKMSSAPATGDRRPEASSWDREVAAAVKYKEADALFSRGETFKDPSFWPSSADFDRGSKYASCTSCFDAIVPDVKQGFSGRAVRWRKAGKEKLYHVECFWKFAAPSCDYCSKPLGTAEGFSGAWGVYNKRKYHVECYQKYAGPRCSICFDVIFADPSQGFSGRWVSVPKGIAHLECHLGITNGCRQEPGKSNTIPSNSDRDVAPPYQKESAFAPTPSAPPAYDA